MLKADDLKNRLRASPPENLAGGREARQRTRWRAQMPLQKGRAVFNILARLGADFDVTVRGVHCGEVDEKIEAIRFTVGTADGHHTVFDKMPLPR